MILITNLALKKRMKKKGNEWMEGKASMEEENHMEGRMGEESDLEVRGGKDRGRKREKTQ